MFFFNYFHFLFDLISALSFQPEYILSDDKWFGFPGNVLPNRSQKYIFGLLFQKSKIKDKTQIQMDYELNGKECTFRPDLSPSKYLLSKQSQTTKAEDQGTPAKSPSGIKLYREPKGRKSNQSNGKPKHKLNLAGPKK